MRIRFFADIFKFAWEDFKTECGIASMDFSAFLGLPMQKNNDQPKLRIVDESSEWVNMPSDPQLMDDVDKLGSDEKAVRLEAKDRSELKFRTYETKLEEWVDQEDVTLEDGWNANRVPTGRYKRIWIAIGLILFLGIGWMVFDSFQVKEIELAAQGDSQSSQEHKDQAGREASQTIATIKDVVRKFYRSKSVDEMSKYVRHAERVRPLMEDYYSEKTMKPSEVISIVDLNPLTIGNRGGFWSIITKLDSGVNTLVVEVNSSSDVKVDWETNVCSQPMDWERFVKDRPKGYRGDFRVYVERDNYYNYEFADSDKYQAYKITALKSDEVIYGYAPRDSKTFREIDRLITHNKNQKYAVILRLYLQEGLQSKSGVLIESIVAPRWLLLDSPEVEKP
jgi:hypothetical protein